MKIRRRWLSTFAFVTAMALVQPTIAGQSQGREAQREKWQKVDEILQAMQVQPGSVVADVGAGDGFFTSRLSTAVGAKGRVLAVDVSADALRRLRARVADEALSNVEIIEGTGDDPRLPAGSLDAALIVNAYHEMTEHQAILARIRSALKPGGRLVIVEPVSASRRDSRREEQTRNHEIGVDFVRADARAAGFKQVALHDPFTQRPQGNDEEWMLILTTGQTAVPEAAPPTTATSAAQVFSARNEEWKAPELRISVDEFKRLQAAGEVLILDVRDPQSYRQGHLPGTILMTPEELSTEEGRAKLKGEKRTIVAYCS